MKRGFQESGGRTDKTLIILDTNILMEGNNKPLDYSVLTSDSKLIEFFSFLKKHKIDDKIIFGIPEVVFEEHFFHKKKRFDEDFENLKEKVSQFNQMKLLDTGELNLAFKESFNYKKYLSKTVDNNNNFILLKLDEGKKKEIFEKVLGDSICHKNQFKRKGDRNFKDAVIWETICSQDLREYAWVILFHQNPEDFPKNENKEEINRASEMTGKIIHVLTKYEDLEKDLEKVYMFVEKDIKEYIKEYFKDIIKEDIESIEGLDCILNNFELIEDSIMINKVDYSDIAGTELEGENMENFRIVKFEFKTDIIYAESFPKDCQEFVGEILFDNNVKEIRKRKYGEK